MSVLAIDTEANTYNKGNVFDRRYKCVAYSWADSSGAGASKTDEISTLEFAERIGRASHVVGYNLKYDLHALRRQGIRLGDGTSVWCCQVAEFVRSRQTKRYPALDEALTEFGLELKYDVVKEEYWNKGIQTDQIPWEILSAYAEHDARQTLALYYKQMEVMTPAQIRLVRLKCLDLLVLEEMEWNGLRYDEELCDKRAEEIRNQISEITDQLCRIYPDVPINFNSGDHLSAFLYGGTIAEERREVIGFYKTGAKIGQPRYKLSEVLHELPRLVVPLKGSELKKEGFYATNADTLLKLKGSAKTKSIIELIQKQTRLGTLLSKTYEGLRKANREMNWEPEYLHGQYNQVVAATGRLSSSQPK